MNDHTGKDDDGEDKQPAVVPVPVYQTAVALNNEGNAHLQRLELELVYGKIHRLDLDELKGQQIVVGGGGGGSRTSAIASGTKATETNQKKNVMDESRPSSSPSSSRKLVMELVEQGTIPTTRAEDDDDGNSHEKKKEEQQQQQQGVVSSAATASSTARRNTRTTSSKEKNNNTTSSGDRMIFLRRIKRSEKDLIANKQEVLIQITSDEEEDKGGKQQVRRRTAAEGSTSFLNLGVATPSDTTTTNNNNNNLTTVTTTAAGHHSNLNNPIIQQPPSLSRHANISVPTSPGAFRHGGNNTNDNSSSHHHHQEEEENGDRSHSSSTTNTNSRHHQLVNAIAVSDEDDLEVAQEISGPAAATKETRASKFTFWSSWKGVLAFLTPLLALGVVLVIVFLLKKGNLNQNGQDFQENASAQQQQQQQQSFEFIIDLPNYTRQTIVDDMESPQALAYKWLLEDPYLEDYTPERKIQRYALATLFYATNGEKWTSNKYWLSYEKSECIWYNAALLPPLSTRACAKTGDNDNGDDDTPDHKLQALVLIGNHMQGTLPRQLGLLTGLGGLVIGDQGEGIIGTIPMEIWELPNLLLLALHKNHLSGTIPTTLGSLEALHEQLLYLDLSWNVRITGTVPSELGLFENLYHLGLGGNQLTGNLPAQLGVITRLELLALHDNMFTGTIPTGMFQRWGALTHLEIQNCDFSGTLPTEMGLLTSLRSIFAFNMFQSDASFSSGPLPSQLGLLSDTLTSIHLYTNQLTGTIPESWWHLSSLVVIYLQENNLHGTIPSNVGQSLGSQMQQLNVAHNRLSGTIPSSIGLWTGMLLLHLTQNSFSGSIPSQLWQLTNLRHLSIGSNLTGSCPQDQSFPDLEYADVGASQITGTIPDSLCQTRNLGYSCSDHLCGCNCSCTTSP